MRQKHKRFQRPARQVGSRVAAALIGGCIAFSLFGSLATRNQAVITAGALKHGVAAPTDDAANPIFALIPVAFARNGNGNGNGGGNGNGNGGGNGNAGGNGNGNAGGNGNGNAGGNGNGNANSNAGGVGKAKGKTANSDNTTADAPTGSTVTSASTNPAVNAGHDIAGNEVLAIDAGDDVLSKARQLGFALIEQRNLTALGISLLRLRTPPNTDAVRGLALLRSAMPQLTADVNALYQSYLGQGSETAEAETAALPATDYAWRMTGWPHDASCGAGQRIGLIDTALSDRPPLISERNIHQRSFVEDSVSDADTRHGTAIANLLVGQAGDGVQAQWHGLLPSADLYAAAVFERHGSRSLASAMAIAEALDWLVSAHVRVVNISLSGEPNLLMEVAVHHAAERGTILIAAAGNNGPSAPPAYPGAYSGVIAVTAVDQNANVFHDANQGSYIAFAAPGVRIWIPGGGSFGQYLTGTSFAAPFVAAAATLAMAEEKDTSPDQLSRQMAAHSRHLGSPGRNPIYGYGLITAGSICRASTASAQ
jgi:hypothetical protein